MHIYKMKGFTLAEVLITLGIIGIIAALTLPNLIYNYKKSVVETRLQKVYSVMNQAVMLSEVENGDKKDWYEMFPASSLDWYNTYLAKYIKSTRVVNNSGAITIYFADGSALAQGNPAHIRDWLFYPGGNPEKCNSKYSSPVGRCVFMFLFQPTSVVDPGYIYHYDKGFEPYKYSWDGTEAGLYSGYGGCETATAFPGAYCSTLIQYNGWKIPDDYPFKVSY